MASDFYCATTDEFARFIREGYVSYNVDRHLKKTDLPVKYSALVKKLPLCDSSSSIVIIGSEAALAPSKLAQLPKKVITRAQHQHFFTADTKAKRIIDSLFPALEFKVLETEKTPDYPSYSRQLTLASSSLAANKLLTNVLRTRPDRKKLTVIKNLTTVLSEDLKLYDDVSDSAVALDQKLEQCKFSLPAYFSVISVDYASDLYRSVRGISLKSPSPDLRFLQLTHFLLSELGWKSNGCDFEELARDAYTTLNGNHSETAPTLLDLWVEIKAKAGASLAGLNEPTAPYSPVKSGFLFSMLLLKILDCQREGEDWFGFIENALAKLDSDDIGYALLPAIYVFAYSVGYSEVRQQLERYFTDSTRNDSTIFARYEFPEKMTPAAIGYRAKPTSPADRELAATLWPIIKKAIITSPKRSKSKIVENLLHSNELVKHQINADKKTLIKIVGNLLTNNQLTTISKRELFAEQNQSSGKSNKNDSLRPANAKQVSHA